MLKVHILILCSYVILDNKYPAAFCLVKGVDEIVTTDKRV